ncbi:MAG: restriction endonuclease [bacterium]|nr:restriction endonuclease [bacterium]
MNMMPFKKELDWKKYESLTKYIYETLGKESGVKIEGYGNNCKVIGKSGVCHQIDVLTSHSDGIHKYRTAIECKYWKEKINKDIVMKVASIIEDAHLNKGVIVSKNGFTTDGISYAKSKNIGLVELREMEDKDLEGRGRVFGFKSWILRPEILSITIDNEIKTEKNRETVEVDKMKVRLAEGVDVTFSEYLMKFNKDLHKEKEFHLVIKRYELPGAILINEKTNAITKIKGLIFTGILTKLDTNLKFHPVDQIWLIMKLIFEEKTFTISENGTIKEDKNQI